MNRPVPNGQMTTGEPRRRCGECTLCCTVMGVLDLPEPKLPAVRCKHVCSRGCRIYRRRPGTCRDFACVWVQGGLPKDFRPDKVGMVFTVEDEGETLVGFYDTARPGLWRIKLRDFLIGLGRRGALVKVGAPSPGSGKVDFIYDRTGEVARPPDA